MINEVDLPIGWVVGDLGDVCDILDAQRIPVNAEERKKRIAKKSEAELYPYYGATGEVGKIDDYIFDGQFVLLGEDAAPFFDSSKDTAYLAKGKFWVNNHAHIIKSSILHDSFLCFFLNQFNFEGYVSGTTRLKLPQGSMKQIPVKFPSINEQNRIVDKIEVLFSEVDAGIENLTLAKRQLEQYRQSLLKHAFEGKLTVKWREEYAKKNGKELPNADELLEQIQTARQDYYDQQIADWEQAVKDWEAQGKESAKPRKPSALIKPEKNSSVNNYLIDCFWKKVSFSELYDIFIGSTPSRSIAEYWNGNINWVSSGEVTFSNIHFTKEKITQLGLVKTSTSVHPIGTVMLAMIGEGKTRGQASILKIEACHNQNTAALRVNNDLLSSEYLYFYLLYSYEMTRRIGSGNNQKALNKTVIQNMTIPICSFEEQTEIAQILEKQNNAIESSKQTLDKYLKKATLLKTSILHKAFQGKLVHQDPNDPPARELLAQIKAEREAKALAEKQAKQDKAASKSKAKAKSSKTAKKSKKDEQITLPL